jgi:hypothetical protein
MDQGVIASMKRHYWTNLLRTLADEDHSIIALWEKSYSVGCYVQHISGMVFCESRNICLIVDDTFRRSKRRYLQGFHNKEISKSRILGLVYEYLYYEKFENIVGNNFEEWLQNDACELGGLVYIRIHYWSIMHH